MLITVHREITPWDAHIIVGRLRAEGLHPSLLSEYHVSAKWVFSTALGGVQIQVPLTEVACACKVLDDWRAGFYQEAMENELGLPNTARCPQCQHSDWVPMRDVWSRLLACVMWVFWSVNFPPEIIGRRCRACGYVNRFSSPAKDVEFPS